MLHPGPDLSMGKVGSCPGPIHFRGPVQMEDHLEFSLLAIIGPYKLADFFLLNNQIKVFRALKSLIMRIEGHLTFVGAP